MSRFLLGKSPSRQAKYMGKLYAKCCNVLGLIGDYPGPAAQVFCFLFIQHAKAIGRTKADTLRIFDMYWERVGANGDLLQSPEKESILDG